MHRLTVADYAALSVRLAASPNNAAATAVLSEAGLTQAQWDAEEQAWEAELSRAMDREDEVPQILLVYFDAIQAAQHALSKTGLTLEVFADILSQIRRGAALDHVLRRHGVMLPDFLAAQTFWMQRAFSDPEVRRALEGITE